MKAFWQEKKTDLNLNQIWTNLTFFYKNTQKHCSHDLPHAYTLLSRSCTLLGLKEVKSANTSWLTLSLPPPEVLSVGRLCPINKCHLASCRGLAQGWQFNRLSWRDEGRYTHPHCHWSLPGLTEGQGAACLTSLSRLLLPLTETKRSPDWQTWWSLWWWWWRWWWWWCCWKCWWWWGISEAADWLWLCSGRKQWERADDMADPA